MICNEVSKALAILTPNHKIGLARMASLKCSEEFQARQLIAETFSHSGKILQLTAGALDCALGITECEERTMADDHLQFGAKVNRNQSPKKSI